MSTIELARMRESKAETRKPLSVELKAQLAIEDLEADLAEQEDAGPPETWDFWTSVPLVILAFDRK